MGHGSYTSADWSRLKASAGITAASSHQELFRKSSMEERFDPKFIHMREARDSEDHPESTPIILGLDVTGSMGYLSAQIAKEGLNETMMKLFSTKPVTDPQIMFAAIGDVRDKAPLQVTQFESDIRIAEQLMDLWLEGRGGDAPEDYPLIWYFAAHHVSADRFEKHGKKGYIFTIGDADCHPVIKGSDIEAIFSDTGAQNRSAESLAKAAGEKFQLFHIHLTKGSSSAIPKQLQAALPGHVMRLESGQVDRIPELIVSTMLLDEGRNQKDILAMWETGAKPVVESALSDLVLSRKKKGFVF